MFRSVQVDIEPNTLETAPATATIKLQRGVITEWFIGFPDGAADHVHASVYHFEHQILPASEAESLFWNNYVFHIREHYVLEEEPYEIEVRAWSEDDSYDQYVVVGVVVEPIEEVSLKDLFRLLLNRLAGPGAWE